MPHKIKFFIWRLCRDNIPVCIRLKDKGVDLPIICPICSEDIEHLLHLFFDCPFAKSCWNEAELNYDMREVQSAPEWLLNKLEAAQHEEIVKICVVLWGIWFWRNKKVWNNQLVNPPRAMVYSFNHLKEWKAARIKTQAMGDRVRDNDVKRWKPPESCALKLNVDASFFPGADTFSIGMVIRDHAGVFIEGRSMTFPCPTTVFEAECIGVKEALSWLTNYQSRKVFVETDSLLTVRAIYSRDQNLLEVGHIVEQCKTLLQALPDVSVCHIRKQANKVAHSLARIPCLSNCFIMFSSPPAHLVETILSDILF